MSLQFPKSFAGSLLLLCFFQLAVSQDRVLGTWKSFMPYVSSCGVFDAGEKVYCASSQSVFSYKKGTGEIQIYDKSTGLSDVGIRTADYDPDTKFLIIAYSNNNLDLIYDGTDIYNIPDIKNNSASGAIGINGISFYNGNAYISSDMGISVVNLTKKEISNTYIIGSGGTQTKVYATAIDGTNIYAATAEGVKFAALSTTNLQNFNSWILFDSAQNLSKKKMTGIASFNGKVYAVSSGTGNAPDTICEFHGTLWQKTALSNNDSVLSFSVTNNALYFSTWNLPTYDSKNAKIDASGILQAQPSQGHIRPVNWFESEGISWEADFWNGLFRNNQGAVENIIPDSPFSTDVVDLAVKDNAVYVATGGADESWEPIFNGNGFFTYKNDHWSYRNQYSDPLLTDSFKGIITMAAIPATGKVYAGSYLYGLFELNTADNSLKIYNKNTHNSTLELTGGTTLDTRISALATDQYNNLWIANAGGTKPIKMLAPDGTWRQFSVPFTLAVMKRMMVDRNDQLRAPLRSSSGGLLVRSYNGTLDDESDDQSRILNVGQGNGGLPSAGVYCVAEDKDGNIWVGTDAGIAVYYCAGSVLSTGGCDADQIKVERDGYIGYLFGTESVRAIAVDAANRKWIGTTNGLWLISDDGKNEILKFNTDNSPLPSNQVTDIAIDDETGEVFIGTLGGLVSYQGDAIADCKDCDGALVYPNPVKPDYNGPIAIKGLADDAYVKITDVAGSLVFQGKANGTQMIWNGKGYTNGIRAKSGVYLVFSSTDLGKEKRVAKILLTN